MMGMINFGMFLLVCTVPAVLIVGVVHFFRYKERAALHRNHLQQEADLASRTELKREVQELRERIQVLEAIITDSKYDLVREFEDLEKNNKRRA